MTILNLSRRSLIVIPALVIFPLSSCSPSKRQADLSAVEGMRLRVMQRFVELLFPIEGVGVSSFKSVAQALLDNPDLGEFINAAVESFNDITEGHWLDVSVAEQTQSMKARETQTWFVMLFIMSRALLFDLPDVWSVLDYEGPSIEFGGYKYRGFDDIDWLPQATP